jgi:hypothetical protein
MPATITFTGTFTDLIGLGVIADPTIPDATFPPGGAYSPNTQGNEADVQSINLDALKQKDGNGFDELRQFIQLVATAYKLNYWSAANLVYIFMKAHMPTKRDQIMLGDAVVNDRLYIP